ncbi:YcxB-like protein [Hydrogenoanaerobacterium saccharovorans]|uniref:YcxB-like protein n=1 Tax=Hydrogenoanaerobacterium saccharovorans TaxID=474960 RepID=A0A1H8BNY0_9FIRM|nr:YcxB family protein [Hydrogenoanaerobacterium saccharovorans]RPF47342.1 YcxB-like protein [Hydrogenoanaerobacterium saccharovorans]SEM83738.1 YcxB-like protein [Hydrogenoanaerobacterium saccharovorans]
MIKIDYKLNENDYLMFNEYHLLNSYTGKKSLTTFRMMLPIISLLAILIFFIASADLELILIEVALLFILSIVWIIFSKNMLIISMKKNIKKLTKDGKLPFSEEGTLIFDDDFISDKNSTTESKTRYTSVQKFCITDKAVYIYFSAVQAYIVPFSAFLTETDKQDFINFINQKFKITNYIK